MEPTRIFRSGFGRVLTGATLVGAACAVVSLLVTDGVAGLLRYGAIPALVSVLVWALFWRPEVRLEDDGVTVVNVWRTVVVPWDEIQDVGTRWALEIVTSTVRVSAWAVPPASGVAARTPGLRSRSADDEPRATAEDVAGLVRDRLAGNGPTSTGEKVRTTWHTRTVVAVAALAAISVIAPRV